MENEDNVFTAFQPHFDYDDWEAANSPSKGQKRTDCIFKGFDMFATKDYFYIVRSDLDRPVFMKIGGLHDPKYRGKIYDLPEAYRNGDHYFADDGTKYVIHGDIIHSSTDLSTDTGSIKNQQMSSKDVCRDGMHYFSFHGSTHKVSGYKVIKLSNINESGEKIKSFTLHEKLQNAICYFALGDFIYVIKSVDIGGGTEALCFYKVKNIEADPGLSYRVINKSIQLFLPGGYTINSPATPVWESIGSIHNDSSSAVSYGLDFSYSHGRNTSETDTLENHWDFEFEESGDVSSCIAKASTTATQKYGGSQSHTTSDEWSEGSEESISFAIELAAGASWALWQPTIKLGGQKTLVAGKDVTATDGDAPEDIPWT